MTLDTWGKAAKICWKTHGGNRSGNDLQMVDGGETPHRTVSLQEVMFNASLRNVELKPPTVITHTYIIYIYIYKIDC